MHLNTIKNECVLILHIQIIFLKCNAKLNVIKCKLSQNKNNKLVIANYLLCYKIQIYLIKSKWHEECSLLCTIIEQ